jgi:PAS domain S-box-containing protein
MQPPPLQPPLSRDDEAPTGELSIAALNAMTIDRAPVGIAHFDLQGRFLFVNPRLCALFGFTRDELLAMTFQEVSCAEDLPRCFALLEQVTTGAIPQFTHEKRFERSDGTFVYTRVIVSPVRDERDAVAYFLAIVEDLSERWSIDQARKDAEARLLLALEASGTGIYRYDFRKQALDWAHNLANVFGFAPGEDLQSLERLLGAIHPDDLPVVLEHYERSRTEGADFDHEFRIVRPDASVRWISDRARMSFDADGTPRFLTGACIDVTARHDSQSREHVARSHAERAIRTRDDVLAVVAHDLRNSSHAILMSVAAAESPAISNAARGQQLSVIRRTARSMDDLICDLLDVTQIEKGQLVIERAPVAIGAVIGDAIDGVAPRAAARGLKLVADIAPDLPEVAGDRERLAQVLNNLIDNSMAFTPDGGRITITAHPYDGGVAVTIADTGCGIPAERLAVIFHRYWQVHRGSHRAVGLGLAIVKGIVDAHGGTIEMTSGVDEGTTVRFTLPA